MTKNQNTKNLINSSSNIVQDIINISKAAQTGAIRSVNAYLVIRNWLIGKRIHEELLTNRSNDYGKHLIENLSKELSKYGKGFDRSSLYKYLRFYRLFTKIVDAMCPQSIKNIENTTKKQITYNSQLGFGNIFEPPLINSLLPWSFYRVLIRLDNQKVREWYAAEAFKCHWNYRQLKRNIKTNYYQRVLSHQIEHKQNQIAVINPNDYLKSLFVFEFVDFNKKYKFKESELEKELLVHLKDFILELGKGYSFVGNQIHIRSNENDYYVDLVFYNSIMKCNVLIDLKVGKISHKDIGQMELYLKLFDDKVKQKDDNPSIGIILSSDTNYDVAKYLTLETDNHVVSAKYMTYLPSKDELLNEIRKCKMIASKQLTNS